ncbi:MAG: carboxypeptidase regulatory-like domain-containing protein, partial [Lewinellaceae bacterium]|nr:carboxypeptidase regulatory-like domain-containing protein [Lewinellaceae bacterium]
MNGKITDESGEALIGANIVALHQPSGTSYGTATDLEGLYRIPSMRVGGPYQITVSYTGYSEKVFNDVYLRLGESFRLNITLEEGAVTLEGIVVTAAPGSGGKNAGASKQISEQDILVMPTLNRDLKDFTRLTPQVREAFGGGISIAGVNNRYNAIYIDGAVNNDVFGLSSQGTNGGQTGIAPFSVDIIDQVQVVISPYDVSLGGFAGGGINAVTKSGTNTFKGTAYYFNQNENLAGKTNKQLLDRLGSTEGSKLADFSQKLYGASLGGPLIKDKVFFFVNAEIRDDQTPSPFNTSLYEGDASASDLQGLRSFLQNQYGYDPGDFGDKVDKLEGLSLFAKLDINLGVGNKLTLRHQFTKAENTDQNGSSNRTINFANNGVYFPSKTNSFAAELNSTFGTKASNNLIVGITSVRDDRDPIGSDFPYVTIFDGLGIINLGSEQFSTANDLQQDIITITDNFKLYKGKHTFTFGTHNEFSSFYNLFIRQNYGVYEFATLADFLAGNPARGYDR